MGLDGIHRAVANRPSPTFFYIVSRFDYAILLSIMNPDKRLSPRFSFTEPVVFAQPQIGNHNGVAGNISLSGMSLRVQGFIPMGTVLELQICLGDSPKLIWVKAQVVRMREALSEDCYEVGLRFIHDEECIKAIGKYLVACRSNQLTK